MHAGRCCCRVVVVALVLTLTGAATLSPKDQFVKSVAEAKAYLETPEGRAYDQAISTYFEQNNGPLLMDCFQIVKDPDASPFELVFTLSKDGACQRL